MTDTTRETFEAWAVSKSIDITKSKDAWGNDIYQHPHVDSMWFGWQAATLAAQNKRQPLTDEQIAEKWRMAYVSRKAFTTIETYTYFAREIEALHGIKQ